jgi:phage-related minor tail protein
VVKPGGNSGRNITSRLSSLSDPRNQYAGETATLFMLEIILAAARLANEPSWRISLVAALIIAGVVMILAILVGYVAAGTILLFQYLIKQKP